MTTVRFLLNVTPDADEPELWGYMKDLSDGAVARMERVILPVGKMDGRWRAWFEIDKGALFDVDSCGTLNVFLLPSGLDQENLEQLRENSLWVKYEPEDQY